MIIPIRQENDHSHPREFSAQYKGKTRLPPSYQLTFARTTKLSYCVSIRNLFILTCPICDPCGPGRRCKEHSHGIVACSMLSVVVKSIWTLTKGSFHPSARVESYVCFSWAWVPPLSPYISCHKSCSTCRDKSHALAVLWEEAGRE